MSITFHLARADEAGNTHLVCETNHYRCDCTAVCDCVERSLEACEYCRFDMNVANSNAAMILERLGVEFDYCGSIDATDMLGRAMVGNVGRSDDGMEAHATRDGGATMIDCGFRPGYFAEKFGVLADMATFAMERGLVIAWG